jgi:predicted alpha/beta hydrolase
MSEILAHLVRFPAKDGVQLTGRWFRPPPDGPALGSVIVVAGGGGIPAKFYRRLAGYLAEHGAVVLTFDYRGIGLSRDGSLRGFRAGIEDWGGSDLEAALSLARSAYPELRLGALAHSISALLIGAAESASELEHLILFGPHTGYYGDYRLLGRWPLFAVWHVLMPAVTKMVGYFPARALGLGQDLPAQIALDWGGRRHAEIMATPKARERFATILARYGNVRARTLAISISDDSFAPPRAAKRLLGLYPNMDATHEVVTPASQGCRRLGHFGFLRPPAAPHLWARALAWLLQSREGGRASHDGALSGVPPSGTKENALAGSTTS